jgi:hypothetical protein
MSTARRQTTARCSPRREGTVRVHAADPDENEVPAAAGQTIVASADHSIGSG